jgi:hypothetical protein
MGYLTWQISSKCISERCRIFFPRRRGEISKKLRRGRILSITKYAGIFPSFLTRWTTDSAVLAQWINSDANLVAEDMWRTIE